MLTWTCAVQIIVDLCHICNPCLRSRRWLGTTALHSWFPQRISERRLWSRGEWASRLMARLSVPSPRSLKDRLEPDLSDMDKFLEKLGPLNGQGREPPHWQPSPTPAPPPLDLETLPGLLSLSAGRMTWPGPLGQAWDAPQVGRGAQEAGWPRMGWEWGQVVAVGRGARVS